MDIQSVTLEPWPTFELPKDEVKATLQFLAHKTKKPVTFLWYTENEGYTPQGVSVRVFVNDGLVVTYSLSQVTLNGEKYPLSLAQRGMALALVQDDWKKIADEEGQFIGAVDHNRIIIPIDITATDSDAARAILAYVVEQAIPLLDFDLEHILKEKEEEFTAHFTSAFQQSVKMRLKTRQDDFVTRSREAEEAYYTVLDFEKERPVMEGEINFLKGLAEKPQAHFTRLQARALLQVQQSGSYSQLTLNDDGTLKATTAPITIEYDGYEFPVGRYEIQIPGSGDVRIKALDEHPNAEHPHPHVNRDGRPCLGNISGDLAKLIGKMRYAEALQLLSQFLASYNPDNPYEKVSHFDPSGEYRDEDDDPCQDCDDKCTPYCIFSCEHNGDIYTCSDCCELRTEYCYRECDHNEDHERFHPCEECEQKGTEHCYLKCRYNEDWKLQDPCDECEKDCDEDCPYNERKEALAHAG